MIITANFSGGEPTVTTESLYQWDIGQQLKISGLNDIDENTQVHFANDYMNQAIVKDGNYSNNELTVDIPNEVLCYGNNASVKAWVYINSSYTEGNTVCTALIPVIPRKRPNDYVSPEDPDSKGIIKRASELLENYETDLASKLDASAGAVKTSNIDNGAVTTAKLAASAVTTAKLASGAVTSEKLDSSAVTSEKLGSGVVTTAKLDSSAVTSEKLASGAVTTEKLGSGAVASAKLASGAVTLSKLDSGVIDKNLGTQGAAAEAAVTGAAIKSISLNESSQSITLSTGVVIEELDLITGLSIPYGTKIYVKLGFSASSNPVVTEKAVQIRANGKFIVSLNRGAVNKWTEVTLSSEQLTSGEIITRLGVLLARDVLSTQTDFILSVRSSIIKSINDNIEGRLPASSGAVKTANLDDGAVTTAKLASNSVTLNKLHSSVIDNTLSTQGAAAESSITGASIKSISLNESSQSITLSTGVVIEELDLITGLSIPYGTKIYVKLGFSASSNPVVAEKAVQIRANGKFIVSLNRGAVNKWTEVTLSSEQLTSGEIITRLGVYLARDVLSTQTDFILFVRSSIIKSINDNVEGRLSASSGAVKTANLDDGAVTIDKLSEDLSAQIQQISSCKHYTKKIMSRQGQGYGYPDNSLEGITAALKDGYRNIRLSVASTSDNVIYCTHSYELSDNTSYQTPVITQNGQPYTQNVVINDVTSEFIDSILYKGYAIPKLDEALEVISLYDADVTLEVKDDFSATAIQDIIDAIKFYSINITLSGLPQQVEPFANVYGGLNLGLIFHYSVNDAATYKARFEGKYKTVRFDCFRTDTITKSNIINNIHPDVKLKLGGSFAAAQAREYMKYLDVTEYQGKVSDIY